MGHEIRELIQKVKQTFRSPTVGEEFPSICSCGGQSWNLKEEDNYQVQVCKTCSQRYRSLLAEAVRNGVCPTCRGALYEGPSGGAAMNIYCKSGHRWWYSAPFGFTIVKPLPPVPVLTDEVKTLQPDVSSKAS